MTSEESHLAYRRRADEHLVALDRRRRTRLCTKQHLVSNLDMTGDTYLATKHTPLTDGRGASHANLC